MQVKQRWRSFENEIRSGACREQDSRIRGRFPNGWREMKVTVKAHHSRLLVSPQELLCDFIELEIATWK